MRAPSRSNRYALRFFRALARESLGHRRSRRHRMPMESQILTYASPQDPWWKRWAMHAIEDLSGRRRLLPIYRTWRTEVAGKSPRMMNELLDMIGTSLEMNGCNPDPCPCPVPFPPEIPLLIVPN